MCSAQIEQYMRIHSDIVSVFNLNMLLFLQISDFI